jgi:hypothetical protein
MGTKLQASRGPQRPTLATHDARHNGRRTGVETDEVNTEAVRVQVLQARSTSSPEPYTRMPTASPG